MKVMIAALGATAGLTAGCATMPPKPIADAAITYETAPCFGTCPVYAVTIRPDGSGTFEGKRFTAVTGLRTFQATPQAYRDFAARLAPYRPAGERLIQPGGAGCGNAPTDMPSTDVRWNNGAHLNFYRGCRSENEALAVALETAPTMLPIADMIGKPTTVGR